jgi:gliding motility-associated protein GldC
MCRTLAGSDAGGKRLNNYLRAKIKFMAKSTITIDVELDEGRVPQNIQWKATESTAATPQQAKAMMVSLWDGADKAALRIDLWTQKMMVDEMADFYFQTFMGMADSFERSTHMEPLVNDIRQFAQSFYKKFQEQQLKDNKLEQ